MDDPSNIDRPRVQSMIVDLFRSLHYDSPHTWRRNTFPGYPVAQCPIVLLPVQSASVCARGDDGGVANFPAFHPQVTDRARR